MIMENEMLKKDITVTNEFIKHRSANSKTYKQGNRTYEKFLMDLECEIIEHTLIASGKWGDTKGWEIDAVIDGKNIDLKVVKKFYNISYKKLCNLKKQINIIDEYHFYEWVSRPNRPLETGDEVTVRFLGALTYDQIHSNMICSLWQSGGYYVKIRDVINKLSRQSVVPPVAIS